MKKTNKLISILLVVAMLLSMAPITVFAAEIVASGDCGAEGNNATWTLDSDGVLTVDGTGSLGSYTAFDTAPWNDYLESIKKVIVREGVTSIGNGAFRLCENLTEVSLPSTLTSVGQYSFFICPSLTKIDIPDKVTTIGQSAFFRCTALAQVTLSDSLESIGESAFYGCESLTEIHIPNSVTSLDVYAFFGCTALKKATLSTNLKTIPERAFHECSSLEEITIPDGVTSIGNSAFEDCFSLAKVSLPNSVTTIDDFAFSSCSSLTEITIPNKLTSLSYGAFRSCAKLVKVTIPPSVTSISSTFPFCSGLKEVTIPSSVTSIENNAFENCSALEIVNVPCEWDGTLYTFDSDVKINQHNWVNKDGVCADCKYECLHTSYTENRCAICGVPHTHSFVYTAGLNGRIVATCVEGGCTLENGDGGTFTIFAPADLYADGTTAKEATVENNLVDTSVAVGDITYSTADGTAPKTAGTYTASVTVGGATASVQFELVKRSAAADNFIYTVPENLVYDGTAKYATVEASPEITGMGAVTVTYYKDGVAVDPINAGTYTVKVSTAETDKYYAINDVELASFTIEKKAVTASATAPDKIYDGTTNIDLSKVVITFDGIVDGDDVEYEIWSGGFFNANVGDNKMVGITYDVSGDSVDNYEFDSGSLLPIVQPNIVETTASIFAKDISDAEISLGDALTYTGEEQTQTVKAVTVDGLEVTYTVSGDTATNVGVYELTIMGNGNFTGTKTAKFEISKADASVTAPTANDLTYNGEAQALVSAGESNGGTMVYSLDGVEYSETIPTGINAGKYTVYYKVIGDENHNDTEPEKLTVTIEKKAVTVSATVPDRIYGDDYNADISKVVIIFDGIVGSDDVGYVVTEAYYYAHTVTDSAPVQVVYNVNGADADNYQFPEFGDWLAPDYGVQATGRVLPRNIANAEIVLGDAPVYNGTEQTQTVTAVTVDGLEVTYTVSGNNATNVGVYELTITGNGNFTGTKTVLFEVAPDTSEIDALTVDNIKSSGKAAIEAVKAQIENAETDLADDEKKAEYKAITDKCDELLNKISETEEKLEEIKEIENNYNPENITSDDKADIEEKIAEIEAVNPDNLTDEQKAEYEEIKASFDALLEEIAAAENAVADIGVELEMFDEERVTIFQEKDIEALKAKIDELLADENMGEAEKAKLGEYKAQADKLIEIINNPCEYFSCRFFYFIWDCLTWTYNGILWLFSKIFGHLGIAC